SMKAACGSCERCLSESYNECVTLDEAYAILQSAWTKFDTSCTNHSLQHSGHYVTVELTCSSSTSRTATSLQPRLRRRSVRTALSSFFSAVRIRIYRSGARR